MKRNNVLVLLLLASISLVVFPGCKTMPFETQGNKKSGNVPEIDKQAKTEDPLDQTQEEIVMPQEPKFILGPGDKIEITVFLHEELHKTLQIDVSGKIMYPLLEDMKASGLSIFELRDKLREGLSSHIIDQQVTVGVVSVQSQKVIVLGEVNAPGFFQAENLMTVFEAISLAGGFTADGKQNSVLLIRGGLQKPKLMKLNLEKALKRGDLRQNIVLQRGDIIYVPRSVISDVNRFFNNISGTLSPFVAFETGYFINQQIKGKRGGAATTP